MFWGHEDFLNMKDRVKMNSIPKLAYNNPICIREINSNGKTQKDGSYLLEIKTNSTEWLF